MKRRKREKGVSSVWVGNGTHLLPTTPYLVDLDRFVAHPLAMALLVMAAGAQFVETVVDVWPSSMPANKEARLVIYSRLQHLPLTSKYSAMCSQASSN